MTNTRVKGILIPIGGNEDKGGEENEMHTLEFIDQGILSRVVEESGGKDAKIVLVPTASSIPDEVCEMYQEAFDKLECTNLHFLDIREPEDCLKPESIELVKTADCVMFSGGDQSKITGLIRDTEIHSILNDRYQNEKFVIAGTSAGAMCMSQRMIKGGRITESFRRGVVRMGKGMSFAPELIIDSHFIKRGRFGRLTEAVARYPKLVGIGLAEDTGMIIRNGNDLEVIGSGMVILFDGRNLKHNNAELLEKGTPMTITNMVTHVLAIGDQYDIENHEITVLPMEVSTEELLDK